MSELTDLFSKDPLALTREDVTAIARAYREAQAKGQFNVRAAKKMKAKEASDRLRAYREAARLIS